jgi:protein-disulfide isomerase
MNAQKLTLATALIAVLVMVGIFAYTRFNPAQSNPSVASGELQLEGQPVLGSADAPTSIVLFEDFLCSHCATFSEDIQPKLEQELVKPGKARLYFINFSLVQNFGIDSETAAIAGECVYEQDNDAFWLFEPALMRAQRQIRYNAEALSDLAAQVAPDLDAASLKTCIEERRYKDRVDSERDMGLGVGVNGTPSVFVNGKKLDAPSFESIKAAVEASN